MPELELKPLPPKEAVDFFRSKGLAYSFDWRDVWQDEHAKAFTVAKAMSRDVLTDIRAAVDQAIAEGVTFEQFRERLKPQLQARGWWGRKAMADPATGEIRDVQLGSTRRLRTIFDTNLRTAFQAGRWQRYQETKALLPYLVYHHTPQEHPRPEHLAWDGTCLPVDDPWWNTHFTPNGWNCKCWTSQHSKSQLDALGIAVTETPIRFPQRVYQNARTGQVEYVERGIDPGFNNNVGKAYLDPLTPAPVAAQPVLPGLDLPQVTPNPPLPEPRLRVPILPKDMPPAQAADLVLARYADRSGKMFIDAAGEPFVFSRALFENEAGGQLLGPDQVRGLAAATAAIRYPDEIRHVWKEGGPTPILNRRYIARFDSDTGEIGVAVDAVVGGAGSGWGFATSLEPGFRIEDKRVGRLAWRRVSAEELGMTALERAAVADYTGSGYERINRALRGVEGEDFDEGPFDTVDQLDGLLGRARLPADMVLYRVVAGDFAFELGEVRIGDVFEDPGFMSTSRDPNAAARFQAEDDWAILVVILARSGDRALDVTAWSSAGGEHEILFARNQALKVLHWDDGQRILTVETAGRP